MLAGSRVGHLAVFKVEVMDVMLRFCHHRRAAPVSEHDDLVALCDSHCGKLCVLLVQTSNSKQLDRG
jgi:hypothetical protein